MAEQPVCAQFLGNCSDDLNPEERWLYISLECYSKEEVDMALATQHETWADINPEIMLNVPR